jgi:hypothetical protein
MKWVHLQTKDGTISVSDWTICQVERDGKVLVIDVSFVAIGEVCWLIGADVWGTRVD